MRNVNRAEGRGRAMVASKLKVVVAGLLVALFAGAAGLAAADRFRVEAYGGLMLMNPRDFNLFGRAEEQYNYILFQERLIGWTSGYFTNDFPKMTKALPAGLRIRYKLNRRFDVSVEVEAFRRVEAANVAGTFSYNEDYALTESRAYDPFRLGIKALSVMGGLQYRIPAGKSTEIELGAAAGWAAGAGLGAVALPSVSIRAISSPATTVLPSPRTISAITPAAGAGTSSTTLSVSTSIRISSIATASPGFFFHCSRVASATDSDSCGTFTSTIDIEELQTNESRRTAERRPAPPGYLLRTRPLSLLNAVSSSAFCCSMCLA